MQLGFIIFARLDSQRLPKKAMLKLDGRPLLGRVIDRCRFNNSNLPIIIATTDRNVDNDIVSFSKKENIKVFRGSYKNVALRAINCCEYFNLDGFIRVCGDRVFLPHELITQSIEIYKKYTVDLVTNVINPTYPKGCTTEIIRLNALKYAYNVGFNSYEKEHITSFFYTNINKFNVTSIPNSLENYQSHNLSLDTFEDYQKFNGIMRSFDGKIEETLLHEIIQLSKKWYLEKKKKKYN